jgi:NADPH:quinone reductase
MPVVRATRFGGPEVSEPGEAPDPEPGPGELAVDVAVAEVLFLDTQLRAGWGREYFQLELPCVLGEVVAGVTVSVGDGVDDGWVGRPVIAGMSNAGEYNGGGYAERAVVAADVALEVPKRVELQHAIAALHDGLMGVSRLEKAELEPGDLVLVTAAGGSIGAWLVPLAARAGATVIAAARGERKLALARERGASVTVDYSEDSLAESVRAEIERTRSRHPPGDRPGRSPRTRGRRPRGDRGPHGRRQDAARDRKRRRHEPRNRTAPSALRPALAVGVSRG